MLDYGYRVQRAINFEEHFAATVISGTPPA